MEFDSANDGIQIPIQSWGMTNFKSVKNSKTELAPLTLVVGKNSAGKSSLLQSILLFSQNSQKRTNQLQLNGFLFRGGSFSELKHRSSTHLVNTRIEDLDFTVRTYNCLKREGCNDVQGLSDYSYEELLEIKNIGAKSIQEVQEKLSELGLSLRNKSFGFEGRILLAQKSRERASSLERKLKSKIVSSPQLDFSISFVESDASSGTAIVNKGSFLGESETGLSCNVEYSRQAQTISLFEIDETQDEDLYEVTLEFNRSHWNEYGGEFDPLNFSFSNQSLRTLFPTTLRPSEMSGYEALALSMVLPPASELGDAQKLVIGLYSKQKSSTTFLTAARTMLDNCNYENIDLWVEDVVAWVEWFLPNFYQSTEKDAAILRKSLDNADVIKALQMVLTDRSSSLSVDDQDIPDQQKIIDIRYAIAQKLCVLAKKHEWKKILDGDSQTVAERDVAFEYNSLFNLTALFGGNRFTDSNQPLMNLLQNDVLYLGPLRESPAASYTDSLSTSPNAPVGVRGESTYALLSSNPRVFDLVEILDGGKAVNPYPLPSKSPKKSGMSLLSATNSWLKEFFGNDAEIVISSANRYGVPVSFTQDSLTNVGVGVSQLLPVIVLCLYSQPGQVVLLEQPELHLHPALQQKLADFFLAMSKSGRQIIVETHSEYLITRLRMRTVQDPSVTNVFKIIFAENDGQTGTKYNPVEVDENGSLETWPEGFFDEATSDIETMVRILVDKQKNK